MKSHKLVLAMSVVFKPGMTFKTAIVFVVLAFGLFDVSLGSVDTTLSCQRLLVGKPQFKHTHRSKKVKGKVVGLKGNGVEARDQCDTGTCFVHAVAHFLDLHPWWKTTPSQSRYSVEFFLALYGSEKASDDIWYGPEGGRNPGLTNLPLLTLLTLIAEDGYLLESDWTPPKMVSEMSGDGRISELSDFVNERHRQLVEARVIYGSNSNAFLKVWKTINTDLKSELLKIYGKPMTGKPGFLENIRAAGQNAYRYIRYERSGWVASPSDVIKFRMRNFAKMSGMSAYYDEEGKSKILEIISMYIGASRPVLVSLRWGLDKNRANTANHAVVLTDLIKDGRDQVSHIRILNSWGPQWGDQGGVWFRTEDFFEALIGIEVLARSQDENGGIYIHGTKEK